MLGMEKGAATVTNGMEVLKKSIRLPHDPVMALLSIDLENTKILPPKDT